MGVAIRIFVPTTNYNYLAEYESSTNKPVHGFAYFDKCYSLLVLKRICLETGILFYAYRLIIG